MGRSRKEVNGALLQQLHTEPDGDSLRGVVVNEDAGEDPIHVEVLVPERAQEEALGLQSRTARWSGLHRPIVASAHQYWWTLRMAEIQLESPVTGVVWKVVAAPGTVVAAGDTVLIVESMKMEIPIESPEDATVTLLHAAEGDQVSEDDVVATIQTV